MDDGAHGGGRATSVGQERDDALLDRLGGLLGSRQELADPHVPGRLVHPHEVGEGTADVDADAGTPCRGRLHGTQCTDASTPAQGAVTILHGISPSL